MTKNIAFALAVGFAATALFASGNPAEARRWGVNARQTRQQNRLYNGSSTGQLTRHEAHRLQNQQMQLAQREARLRQSGNGLTQRERYRLEKQQNALSHNIYRQKHDGQTHQ